MKKFFLVYSFLFISVLCFAQREPDLVCMKNINGIKLFKVGDQTAYPIINVGSEMSLELHFDDLDGTVKNYNYCYQLCNADWQPVDLSPFDYITGFSNGRLNQYRTSSIAKTKYIHYQALLPEKSCMPNKGGNYLFKVYLNGDTSKLAFTRRILVLNNTVPIAAKITQPFNTQLFKTHQKVQFSIDKSKLNILNPQQQLKVVVLQNYRWATAVTGIQPLFMRGNLYEYNGEQDCLFPAGKEYRWVDLRSFRFQSERVDSANLDTKPFGVWLKPDAERTKIPYIYYLDLNGFYEVAATDVNNPWVQGDYANVHFIYYPVDHQPYNNKNLYLIGEMADTCHNHECLMNYNAEKGIYETTLLLKQGYYSYDYITRDINTKKSKASVDDTDGNYSGTENNYTILVYYRSLSARSDELVGAVTINTRNFTTGW